MGPVCQADRGITNMTVLQNHFFCIKKVIMVLYSINDQIKRGIKHDDKEYIN